MKVRYIGPVHPKGNWMPGDYGEVFNVLTIEGGWYRVWVKFDDEDYIFPAGAFEIIEAEPVPPAYEYGDPRINFGDAGEPEYDSVEYWHRPYRNAFLNDFPLDRFEGEEAIVSAIKSCLRTGIPLR